MTLGKARAMDTAQMSDSSSNRMLPLKDAVVCDNVSYYDRFLFNGMIADRILTLSP